MLYPLGITAEILKCEFSLFLVCFTSILYTKSFEWPKFQSIPSSFYYMQSYVVIWYDNTHNEILNVFAPHSDLPAGRGCREEPPSPVFQSILFLLDSRPDTEASLLKAAGTHGILKPRSWIKGLEAKKGGELCSVWPSLSEQKPNNSGLVSSTFGSFSINTYEYGTWRQLMTEVKKQWIFSCLYLCFFSASNRWIEETQVQCEWFQHSSGEMLWHITKQKQSNRRASGLDSASSSSCK